MHKSKASSCDTEASSRNQRDILISESVLIKAGPWSSRERFRATELRVRSWLEVCQLLTARCLPMYVGAFYTGECQG
jgi:hypothetical protein